VAQISCKLRCPKADDPDRQLRVDCSRSLMPEADVRRNARFWGPPPAAAGHLRSLTNPVSLPYGCRCTRGGVLAPSDSGGDRCAGAGSAQPPLHDIVVMRRLTRRRLAALALPSISAKAGRVAGRKRGPVLARGSDPGDAHAGRTHPRPLACFAVASPQAGPLLHAAQSPSPGSSCCHARSAPGA
jgi:hypothetical protein